MTAATQAAIAEALHRMDVSERKGNRKAYRDAEKWFRRLIDKEKRR